MQGILGRLKSVNRMAMVIIALVLIAVVVFIFLLSIPRPPALAQVEPYSVTVVTGDLSGEVVASGLLIPQRDVHLSMGATGIVKEVNVEVGDLVMQGDVLVRLDDAIAQENANKAELAVQLAQVKVESAQHDYNVRIGWTPNQNQVNSAQASLANAEATVKAAQSAYDHVQYLPGVSSTQQSLNLEQATNNYNKAKADLAYLYSNRPDVIIALNNLEAAKLALSSAESDQRAAKEALARMSLLAPFDGTITAVTVDVGEATTGPVAELVTMDLLDVVLDIDEVDIGTLHLNDRAVITFDAWPGLQVNAKVISIAPKANTTANVVNFEVHLALEDSDLDLRAGMTANAVIQSFTIQDTLLAPNEAIFLDPETGYFVYLVTPDGAQKIAVVIGERGDQNTQILSGVSASDKLLITEPHTLLP